MSPKTSSWNVAPTLYHWWSHHDSSTWISSDYVQHYTRTTLLERPRMPLSRSRLSESIDWLERLFKQVDTSKNDPRLHRPCSQRSGSKSLSEYSSDSQSSSITVDDIGTETEKAEQAFIWLMMRRPSIDVARLPVQWDIIWSFVHWPQNSHCLLLFAVVSFIMVKMKVNPVASSVCCITQRETFFFP